MARTAGADRQPPPGLAQVGRLASPPAALLLEVDPVRLARTRGKGPPDSSDVLALGSEPVDPRL